MAFSFRDSLSIVIAGEAGQGIQSIEAVLTGLLKRGGYHVFATKESMSRVRGGTNSTELIVSSKSIPAFVHRIDILIPLSAESIPHLKKRINKNTVIIGEQSDIGYEGMIDVPFRKFASESGSAIMANTLAAGVIGGLLKLGAEECGAFVMDFFAKKSDEIRQKNKAVFLRGHEIGGGLSKDVDIQIARDPSVKSDAMMTGSEAIALGAVAGGVNYVCGYPMSPGTAILEHMAQYSKSLDILVEQVEDEVGVINMALGASFTGSRTMVSTAGGGFTLMTEGISLSGMAEIPVVVHIGQRPGPATGLPTRTEQGDLFLALFAGHGEFARLLLAPGSLQESFESGLIAAEYADRFQVPAFILGDQYQLESYYNTKPFDVKAAKAKVDQAADKVLGGSRDAETGNWIVKTEPAYNRFSYQKNGISPRGVPGYGSGLVTVDSDEHDESGHITESMDVRNAMVEKRLAKMETLKKIAPLPEWLGPRDAKTVVIGWGSTKHIIEAAIGRLNESGTAKKLGGIAQVHFSWVYPLPEGIEDLLSTGARLILVENNETGHFGKLLRMETGINITRKILKYDGLPFSVEELVTALENAKE